MKHFWLMAGRELDALARQRVLVVMCLAVPGLALWLASHFLQQFMNRRSGITTIVAFQNLPGDFYQYLALWGFLGMVLIVPAVCVSAIADERESDTLGLLLMTRLSPFRIILGKIVARLVVFGLIVLALVPAILLFARFQGRFPTEAKAMLGSVVVYVTVTIAMCMCTATLLPSRLGAYLGGAGGSLVAMVALGVSLSMVEDTVSAAVCLGVLLIVLTVGCLIVAAKALKRPYRKPRPMRLEIYYLLSRFAVLGKWLKQRGRLKGSPLRWHTKRYVVYSRLKFLLLWVVLVLLISGMVGASGESERALVWLVILGIGLVGLAAYTSSQLLASERQHNTLATFLSMPDGTRRLIWERLVCSIRLLIVTALIGALPLLYMALVDDELVRVIGLSAYVLALLCPVYLTGLVLGLLMRKPLPAMAFSIASAAVWLVVCTTVVNGVLEVVGAGSWRYRGLSNEAALAILGMVIALTVLGAVCVAATVWLLRRADRVIRL